MRIQLNQAKKHLRQTQKNAARSRVQSYEELLAQYEADTHPNTQHESQRRAKIVARTLQGEASKQLFGKLRQIIKPSEFSTITEPGNVHSVLHHTTSEQLVWDTIISRENMEAHLLSFNREAFRAAAESPCGRGVIHDALTFTSLSEDAERCLHGEIPSAWYMDQQLLRAFLSSFQIPNSVLEQNPIPLEISSDDIIKGFKSWRETTTTSPSGRHLGRYKALITDPVLLKCLCKFLNITISRGIAPPDGAKL